VYRHGGSGFSRGTIAGVEALRFGSRTVPADRALVMAIVNRTRDSFYDQGSTFDDRTALAAVDRVVDEGADIVDIGGVRAGSHGEDVDTREEIRRVVPFVEAIRQRHPGLVISVDTWRHEVARAACAEGADLINDSWAGADPLLAGVAAEFGVGIVCSHTGGAAPRTDPHRVRYLDVVAEVAAELVASAERMVAAGVPRAGVLIDPTHDFGKNTWHGLELLRRLDELVATGWPVLMALSNKDFIGETLDLPVGERLVGTLASTAICALAGARIYRVHQVVETRQTVDMVNTIAGRRPPRRAIRGVQ
jgi:dihydropteroate synthase